MIIPAKPPFVNIDFYFTGGFFTFAAEPILTPSAEMPLRRCTFCAAPLHRGDGCWRLNGYVVCRRCFPAFAERELFPYYIPPEEGDELR